MAKLDKMQTQAIISKLSREANSLRFKLIEEEKKKYTPSTDAIKFSELIEKRNEYKKLSEEATEEIKKFAENLGLKGYYIYMSVEESLNRLRDKEIEEKYPKIDIDAVLDDLIIESIEEDFNADNFIEHYLKQIRK